MVAPADGRVRALKIVVEGGPVVVPADPVPDELLQRIFGLDKATDRQATTAAVVGELTERATNLATSLGARRLTIQGRVSWLNVPAQVTLFACLASEAEGAFKKLKTFQRSWDVVHDCDLATGQLPAGGEPGDSIKDIVLAAIDQAGRPHRLC